jgi:hypothetical protein
VGSRPNVPSVPLPAVASRLQDKPSTAESGGMGERGPRLPSALLSTISSRLQDKPSAAKSGGAGAVATKRIVARCSEPPARQAERNGKRGHGSGSSHLPSALLPALANRLQEKPSAAESGSVGAAAPPAKRFVARGGEPCARETERSGKRGRGGDSPTCQAVRCPQKRAVCKTSRTKQKAGQALGCPR